MKTYTLNGAPAVENCTGLAPDGEVDGVPVILLDRLGREFRAACDATGLKTRALAALCGKTPTTFCNYFRGRSAPPPLVWREVVARRLK